MRKLILSAIIFVLFSSSILFTYVYAEDNTEATDLKTQRDDVQEKLDRREVELDAVQTTLSENLQQVEKLDESIENAKTELQEIESTLEKIGQEKEKIEKELEVAEGDYGKQKKLLDKTLITTYEEGDTHYLDVILSSKDISEFLSNYFLVKELATYESDLVNEVQDRKDDINASKNKLEKMEEQFSNLKANQVKTTKILENTKTVRETFIERLSDEEKALQAQIDDYNQKYAEINRQILEEALNGIDSQYIGGELAWPTPGYTRITSEYGMRYHPILHYTKLHTGVDIGAPTGANFVAANDGIVTKAEYNAAYGNMVIIDHGGGVSTLYAHGSEIVVQVGQTVKRGETVLKVGATGYATGAHAHFEVRLNGVVTDPMPYITNGLIPTTQSKPGEQVEETQ